MNKQKCLIIEPHSDDSCISAYGYLNKLKETHDLYFLLCVTGSTKLLHLNKVVDSSDRLKEYDNYVNFLGGHWINGLDAKDNLPIPKDTYMDTVGIRQVVDLVEFGLSSVSPDLLLIQGDSFHQDHHVVYKACLAALRPCGRFYPNEILMMENPTYVHSDPTSNKLKPNYFVELSEEEVRNKVNKFSQLFPSQIRSDDNYLSNQGIIDWAKYRGMEARVAYAEAFYQFHKLIK